MKLLVQGDVPNWRDKARSKKVTFKTPSNLGPGGRGMGIGNKGMLQTHIDQRSRLDFANNITLGFIIQQQTISKHSN